MSEDKKKIEPVGVLGSDVKLEPEVSNGVDEAHVDDGATLEDPKIIRGVVNDIALFERGERGQDGLSIVVATGKEIRLGRWKVGKAGKCGATVFEVPQVEQPKVNGAAEMSDDEAED